jgi:hypothetical protein
MFQATHRACDVVVCSASIIPDVFRTSSGSSPTSSTHHGNRTAMEIKEIMSRLQRRYQHIKFHASPEETPCRMCQSRLFELQPSTNTLICVENSRVKSNSSIGFFNVEARRFSSHRFHIQPRFTMAPARFQSTFSIHPEERAMLASTTHIRRPSRSLH